MKLSIRTALVAAAAATVVIGSITAVNAGHQAQPQSLAVTPAAATLSASSGGLRVAYYDQWSIYQNAYYLRNVDSIANNLDYLVYDFENIDPSNLTCFEATKASDPDPAGKNDPNAGDGAGDSFADYQKSFGSDISVDGTADAFGMPIVGNFHQLQELKARHPNLKVVLSLGGWTYSKYFSDVAATDASRKKFVSSCVDMFIKGNIPSQGGYGGPGTAAGILDGFDIDWEYPGSASGHLGNHYSASDTANYTALLAEFRSELDALGGKHYSLSAALPGGQDKIAKIQTDKIGQYMDFARDDLRHAWRVGHHRSDELPGPAVLLAERPVRHDPAGHREVHDRLDHQGVHARRYRVRHTRRLPGQQTDTGHPVLLSRLDKCASGLQPRPVPVRDRSVGG
jgi:chitinase